MSRCISCFRHVAGTSVDPKVCVEVKDRAPVHCFKCGRAAERALRAPKLEGPRAWRMIVDQDALEAPTVLP